MMYLFMALFAAGIVAADQITKLLVVNNIPLASSVPAIDGLFRISLWSGCFPLIHSKGELNRGIDLWCEQNGISLDAREAVRQKFYRLRRQYHEKGVIVGKIYHKKKSTYLSQIVQTDKNKSHG